MKQRTSRRASLSVLLALFLIVPLAATPPASGQMQKEVVVVVKIVGIPWFNRMATGVKDAGNKLGIKASLVGPSTADAAAQVAMVEDLVNRGVGVIAVTPTDSKALVPVFKRAKEKGISILTHESPFETSAIDWDVETIDSVKYARLAVDQMAAAAKKAGRSCTRQNPCGFVQLVGGLTVPLHNFWADTAVKYIKSSKPEWRELTSRLPTAESVDDSRRAVLDLTRTHRARLNGVIGWGSLGPLGAAAAVRERGLKDRVVVGGSAIPSSAIQYLQDGAMDWAQLWDPADAGFAMVWIGKQLLEGKKITNGMQIPGMGATTTQGKVVSVNAIILMRNAADARKAGF